MTKSAYLNAGFASLLACILLLIMNFSWPSTDYSVNDVILDNVKLSDTDKGNFIQAMRVNYTIDTIFIFSWIGAWIGLFLHFKSSDIKLIGMCLGLSLFGAVLDISENTIIFSLLIGNNSDVENYLFIQSLVRDFSYWLPMIAAFVLAITISGQKGVPVLLLKLTGIIGVLFAIIGMYNQYFSAIPDYWFGIFFLSAAIFFFDNWKRKFINKS